MNLDATCPVHGETTMTAFGATTVTLACGGVGNDEDGYRHAGAAR